MKKNKIVLITGAGKGIGYILTKKLIEKKYFVYALIKSKSDNQKFKKNDNLKIFNGDVNNLTVIKKIFSYAKKNKSIISYLINNAGIRHREEFLNIKKKSLKSVFQTNFFSIFQIMQVFSKNLIEKKLPGSIINISSIVGQIGFSELSAYASSKAALIALTKSFAAEMINSKIRINCVSPGFTETSNFKKFKKKKKLYNWTINRIPAGRWGQPDEVTNLIKFLLSKNSEYINGENINIDGGWLNS